MEGNRRNNPKKIDVLVGQSVVRICFSCGMGTGHAESSVPATVMQKWICISCGTLNQFEVEFRQKDV